ncbi:hypothetical protein TWF730_005082 [Orbilia blumenaviensis]|uniref:Uncharacterized protein n=1 Tax=Orbilia blumenaviensis TaxID=1796055 RepID=A0AAV9VJI7_9PEZI
MQNRRQYSTNPFRRARGTNYRRPGSSGSDAGPQPGQGAVPRPLGPRYALSVSSDNESDISDDPLNRLRDSNSSRASFSSASSLNGDDEELIEGLNNISLYTGALLKSEGYDSKKGIKNDLFPMGSRSSSPPPAILPNNSPKVPCDDRSSQLLAELLSKSQYEEQVAKAAGGESIVCLPIKPVSTMPQHGIDINTWRAETNTHGYHHGKPFGPYHGSSGAPPIYPENVKPPCEWGSRTQKGSDHCLDENNWGRENRGLRARRRFACPAAKGDPFHNRSCLGVSFPNLAKTRQHLSCAAHFDVVKTPLLPDEIRDPNGWDEIMAYIYPDQEIPSSYEDYHPTMDFIQRWGKGQGKPDFRSTLMRMIKCVMDDKNNGLIMLAELQAIDPKSQEETGAGQNPSTLYAPSDTSGYQTGFDTCTPNSSIYTPGSTNPYVNMAGSVLSQATFTPYTPSINTPTSGSTEHFSTNFFTGNGSNSATRDGFNIRPLVNPGSQHLDTNNCRLAGPDRHHQADDVFQTNPVGGRSPDCHPRVFVDYMGNSEMNIDYPLGVGESLRRWMQVSQFSFENLGLKVPGLGHYTIRSVEEFEQVYAKFEALGYMFLNLIPISFC